MGWSRDQENKLVIFELSDSHVLEKEGTEIKAGAGVEPSSQDPGRKEDLKKRAWALQVALCLWPQQVLALRGSSELAPSSGTSLLEAAPLRLLECEAAP